MKTQEAEILIIHLNGEKILDNCLSSIYKDDKNAQVRLLLNGTSDNSAIIANKFKNIIIEKTSETISFAKAANLLAKKSNSKYIVFLNNDTEVEKNWLKELIATVNRHPNCVACQPKIKSLINKKKFEYAGAAGGFIDKYGYPFCQGRIFGSIEEDNGQYDKEMRIFWGCGSCLLVNRKFFIESGMFDESLDMYSEELDFCWRANNYGKEIYYSPKSIIYHLGNYSIGAKTTDIKNLGKDYQITRNHLIVLIKNYQSKTLLYVLPTRLIFEAIAAIRFSPVRAISFIKTLITLPFNLVRIIPKRRKAQNNRIITDKELNNLIMDKSIVISYFLNRISKFSHLDKK